MQEIDPILTSFPNILEWIILDKYNFSQATPLFLYKWDKVLNYLFIIIKQIIAVK